MYLSPDGSSAGSTGKTRAAVYLLLLDVVSDSLMASFFDDAGQEDVPRSHQAQKLPEWLPLFLARAYAANDRSPRQVELPQAPAFGEESRRSWSRAALSGRASASPK